MEDHGIDGVTGIHRDLEDLLGKIIKEIIISSDKETIIFLTTDEEKYVFHPQADCRNDVWIESTEGTEYLIGEKIIDINQKLLENVKREVYNLDFITQKGTFTIDFRNNHNGYYGGYLRLDEEESIIKRPN